MLALRSKRFFGGRIKEVLRSFNYGQAKREEKHKMSNLPTKEKKEYLRKQEESRSRLTGFDWNSVGYSMHYNRERSMIAWAKSNTDWTIWSGMKNKISNQKIAKEVEVPERILYTFRNDIDLTWWDMMTDENIQGGSKCKMQMAENGTGVIWYGRLDTQPPDLDWGRTNNWKSFATLFTKEWQRDYGRPDKLLLKQYNCFEFRIRGDGRRYEFDVHGNRVWENATSMWTTSIYTKGGYEWETIRVPFHHLFQQYQDLKVRDQTILALEGVWGFRWRLQDDIPGPFKLEIDYMAAAYDYAFTTFQNTHYQNIDAKMGGWQEKTQFNSQSILNHYYHDPYNHLLRKTQNPNNDTHVQRLDTIYGGAGDLH